MKRCLAAVLTLLLVGCGAVSTAPNAGQLLDAPTNLNITGKVLTADAAPTLSGLLIIGSAAAAGPLIALFAGPETLRGGRDPVIDAST